jgi:hypothetical protein
MGLTNESWHALAKASGGASSPFKLYPDGFYSTNEIDLRPLLAKLANLTRSSTCCCAASKAVPALRAGTEAEGMRVPGVSVSRRSNLQGVVPG